MPSISSGRTSGSGFARANTIGSFAILATSAASTTSPAETPMNTSAPAMASWIVPGPASIVVAGADAGGAGFIPSARPGEPLRWKGRIPVLHEFAGGAILEGGPGPIHDAIAGADV